MACVCRPPVVPFEVDRGWSWVICAGVLLWNVVVGGSLKISGILYVEYKDLFGQSPTATGWINSTLGIMMVVMSPVGGYISDKVSYSRLRVVMFGLFTAAALCVAMAGYMPSLPLTIFVYGALLGSCAGLVDPATLSLPSRYFVDNMTTAYGVAFMGNSVGTMVFPALFTICTSRFGFRGAMLIFAGVWLQCLLIPVVAWPLGRRRPRMSVDEAHSNNLKMELEVTRGSCSSINQTKGFQKISLSDKFEPNSPDGSTQNDNGCCSKVQSTAKDFQNTFGESNVICLVLSLFCGTFGYFNSFFVLPPLAIELGLSSWEMSAILFITSIMELCSKVIIGCLVDRVKIKKSTILMTGYSVTAGSAVIISFLPYGRLLYLYGGIIGAFGGVSSGLAIPMLIDLLGVNKQGLVSGIYTFTAGLASAIGPVILGAIAEASGSFKYSLLTCGIMYIIGITLYVTISMFSTMSKACHYSQNVVSRKDHTNC